jgi:hypothetical protein
MLNTNNPILKDLETLKILDSFPGLKINAITTAWGKLLEMFNETDKGKLFWEVQRLTKDTTRPREQLNPSELPAIKERLHSVKTVLDSVWRSIADVVTNPNKPNTLAFRYGDGIYLLDKRTRELFETDDKIDRDMSPRKFIELASPHLVKGLLQIWHPNGVKSVRTSINQEPEIFGSMPVASPFIKDLMKRLEAALGPQLIVPDRATVSDIKWDKSFSSATITLNCEDGVTISYKGPAMLDAERGELNLSQDAKIKIYKQVSGTRKLFWTYDPTPAP